MAGREILTYSIRALTILGLTAIATHYALEKKEAPFQWDKPWWPQIKQAVLITDTRQSASPIASLTTNAHKQNEPTFTAPLLLQRSSIEGGPQSK